MRNPVFILLSLLFLISCDKRPREFPLENFTFQRDLSNTEISNILLYSDHRWPDSLFQFTKSDDPSIQFELALALSSVQDCELAGEMIKRVGEIPYPEIRKMIYFAYGQSCRESDVQDLYEIAQLEKDSVAKVFLTEAIAKSGRANDLIRLMENEALFNDFGLCRALYQFSLRNIFSEDQISKMIGFLSHESDDVRITASNMLARLKGKDLVEFSETLIKILNSDDNVEVRMNIATAFNKVNGSKYQNALLDIALNEKEDFRLRVNAINSLNYFHYESIADKMVGLLQDKKLNIQLEAAQFFLNRCKRKEWNKLAVLRNEINEEQVKATVLAILLKHATNKEKKAVNSHILAAVKSASDPFVKSFYIDALGQWPDNFRELSKIAFESSEIVISSAAMQAFFKLSDAENIKEISSFENESDRVKVIAYFAEVFKMAILSGDATLMSYGAKGFINDKIDFKSTLTDTDFIDVAISNLDLPRDVETLIDLKKSRAFIEGREMPKEKPPLNHFVSIEQLKAFQNYKNATVSTNKGDFTIFLDQKFCPATVANFIELSQRGFYDSLRFHRVENNFVVQGGCPRGDGWGSSGESIRSEFAPKFYKTGSVGMASAGKDTESCQWFVTHYPSIHLDGSYTNFATVTEGMEVVNELQVGDTVYSIIIN